MPEFDFILTHAIVNCTSRDLTFSQITGVITIVFGLLGIPLMPWILTHSSVTSSSFIKFAGFTAIVIATAFGALLGNSACGLLCGIFWSGIGFVIAGIENIRDVPSASSGQKIGLIITFIPVALVMSEIFLGFRKRMP